MHKKIVISLFLIPSLVYSLTLQERFERISQRENLLGDFVVTEYQKNLSFLRLHSLSATSLFLEEINIPQHLAPKKPIDWDAWLTALAPHHTSWLLYEIDISSCKIIDCYSFSRSAYISLSHETSFLTRLMTLPLHKTPLSERKRIGPKPSQDMPDSRKLWNPPKIYRGERCKNPHFEMLQTTWPKDASELSGKLIHLYFDEDNPYFPFPYWIEVGDGYNVFQLHVIDSGHSSVFPQKKPPKPLYLNSLTTTHEGSLEIYLKNTQHLREFQLFAVNARGSIALPYTLSKKDDLLLLTVSQATLAHLVQKKLLYNLHIIPLEDPSLSLETEAPILLFP
ncbi:MAG: hypothetical protein FJZ63_02750 [Chlamydiae bacterium]|nr:hypothetical protein [Chlamydiota bacterium]